MKRFLIIFLCLLSLSIIVPQVSPAKTVTGTDDLVTTAVQNAEADYGIATTIAWIGDET